MRGDDHVIGGDEATRAQVRDNMAMSEVDKAAKHAEQARPR